MIKEIDDSLYSTVSGWWKARDFVPPQREILPRGYVAFVDEVPIFAGFLYKDDRACLGLFIFLTSNPEASIEARKKAFSELEQHVEAVSKSLGIKALITGTNNQNLCDRFLENGFKKYDENAVHLMKGI